MKRRYRGSLIKGLRNIQKEIEKTNTTDSNSKSKPIERWTLFISLVAIIVSAVSLYFQFFYEKYDLRANFISASFINDTSLVATIVYHNKGNSYSTVLGNSVIFYQDSINIEKNSFQFIDNKTVQQYNETFDPLVLTPGQQIHRDIRQYFDFKKFNFSELSINPTLNIKLALAINYINENGYYSTNFIPIGWLKLDSTMQVDDYSVKYKTEILNSDTYNTGMSRKKN